MYAINPHTPSRRIGLVGLFVSLSVFAMTMVGAKPAAASSDGKSVCESVARVAPATGWTPSGEWLTTQPIRKTLDLQPGSVPEFIRSAVNGKSFWFGVLAKNQPNNSVEPMVDLRCFVYLGGKWVRFGSSSLPGVASSDGNVSLKSVLTPEICAKLVAAQAAGTWMKQGSGYTLPPVLAKTLNGDLGALVNGMLNRFENLKNAYIGATLSAPDGAGNVPAKCYVYDATTKSYVGAGSTTLQGGGGLGLTFR
jgi:hypothetical protein